MNWLLSLFLLFPFFASAHLDDNCRQSLVGGLPEFVVLTRLGSFAERYQTAELYRHSPQEVGAEIILGLQKLTRLSLQTPSDQRLTPGTFYEFYLIHIFGRSYWLPNDTDSDWKQGKGVAYVARIQGRFKRIVKDQYGVDAGIEIERVDSPNLKTILNIDSPVRFVRRGLFFQKYSYMTSFARAKQIPDPTKQVPAPYNPYP